MIVALWLQVVGGRSRAGAAGHRRGRLLSAAATTSVVFICLLALQLVGVDLGLLLLSLALALALTRLVASDGPRATWQLHLVVVELVNRRLLVVVVVYH